MEVLSFYWPNVVTASILVLILGLLGRHLVARNQTMEVVLLGQEFQTGLLFAALINSIINSGAHTEHDLHFESILTFIFVILSHFLFNQFLRKNRTYRVEGTLVYIIILTAYSYLIASLSSQVEMHMVKAALGDIVTTSRLESHITTVISITLCFIYYKYRASINSDTIDIALFRKTTHPNASQKIFPAIVAIIMFLSIHLFGSVFTTACLLIPAFLAAVIQVNKKGFYLASALNVFSVIWSFLLIDHYHQLPTTVIIVLLIFIISLITCLAFKRLN